MLITLVTCGRPRWASAIVAHLLEEAPDALIAVCDNGTRPNQGQGEEPFYKAVRHHQRFGLVGVESPPSRSVADVAAPPLWIYGPGSDLPRRRDIPKGMVAVWVAPSNLGGGGGRNELLRLRLPGEPFVRIDDDWLPREHGWLAEASRQLKANPHAGLVRIGPDHRMEDRAPPMRGLASWRMPDCCGPLWLVAGECADALGGFYTGFGATLLDDLEYSRRAVEWRRRKAPEGPQGVLEIGWPIRDLCTDSGVKCTGWNPPWDLFEARCRAIRNMPTLGVPLRQDEPGGEWRRAGRPYKETR